MAQRTLQLHLDALASTSRPDKLEIASLTRFDIPALAALYIDAYHSPKTAESLWEATDEVRMAFDGAFGTPLDDSFIGAWLGGVLVGAVLVVKDAAIDDVPRGPFVTDIMVDPVFQRRGIATALVAEAATRCRLWGYEDLNLRVDTRSAGALQLYEVLGFEDVLPEENLGHATSTNESTTS